MTSQILHYPKAGRCRGCAKLHHDCSQLPFAMMPVYKNFGDSAAVICTQYLPVEKTKHE